VRAACHTAVCKVSVSVMPPASIIAWTAPLTAPTKHRLGLQR
jgi:hypothetical protein